MLWKITPILIALSILCGCGHQKALIGDHPPELVGTWNLLIRSSCSDYGIKSDTLTLHPDGTFEQHVVLKDEKHSDLIGQRWSYNTSGTTGHIALDKRLEFFTPEHSNTKIGEGVATFEVLIVEGSSKPVIVLHPDSDCVYDKR